MASPHYDGEIPFDLAIRQGLVRGWSYVLFQGHDHTAAQANAILAPGNATGIIDPVPLRTTPAVVKVASTDDTKDNSGNVGALTVLVRGLDADLNEQTEVVVLDGQAEVATTNVFAAVNGLSVTTTGTELNNSGRIWCGTGTFTAGVPAVGLCSIEPAENVAKCGVYTVPVGHEIFAESGAMTGNGTAAFKGVYFKVGIWDPTFQLEYETLDMHMGDGGVLQFAVDSPAIPAGSIVMLRGGCLAQTAVVAARVLLWVHKLDRSIRSNS
jgi:hypothetical protein